tara:strand:- start:484 stop:660 length:177 start_codon:yes stop_codon:yes gene_type:complete
MKKITEAAGHGNLRSQQIRHIAELFEYQFPSEEIRKTESTPSSQLGLEISAFLPSGLF